MECGAKDDPSNAVNAECQSASKPVKKPCAQPSSCRLGNRREVGEVARANDMRVVEFADAGSSRTAEPLGERTVARNSAHRSGGLADIGLGPYLAVCAGIFILAHGNQLAADEERGLGGGEVAGAGIVGRDDRLAEQHRLGGAAAKALGAVQGY